MSEDKFRVIFVHFNLTIEFLILGFFALFILILIRMLVVKYSIKILPESAIIVLLGVILGVTGLGFGLSEHLIFGFSTNLFFLILIPPIIFETIKQNSQDKKIFTD
ncbi:sodium/hydrogen exchanger 8 [Anaeramoeba ignava]|uniref:Sodium/hydrogen exchanger 8 n=1 Tax=Anaeramoeba ignava TaxID=1746090 RepID=A0A9Q0LVA2_ANAIG|nr:sodium/hydrogen exchanger 8 [Anaeramoeba ignava]